MIFFFFFSSRRRHTRSKRDWSSDVCSSDLYGGHHQRGVRPGTENVAGIVGLGKAAEIARHSLANDAKRLSAPRDQLEHGLLNRVPHSRINGARAVRTPNTANLVFPGVEGEALLIALDLKGLACSTGAACSSGAVE